LIILKKGAMATICAIPRSALARGTIAGGRCGAARRDHVITQHFFAAGERHRAKSASFERVESATDFSRAGAAPDAAAP
jgi:hypothetical protein